jgi:hypothetical protein
VKISYDEDITAEESLKQVMIAMDSNNEYFHLVVVADHDPNDYDNPMDDS